MALDWLKELRLQLDWHWDYMLRPRLEGLTDQEYLWEPAPGCWSVRPDPAKPARFVPDRISPPPDPTPFTTVGWRVCHLWEVFAARASFHFGDRSWDEHTVMWPGTAADGLAKLDASYVDWSKGLDALGDDGLERKSQGPAHTLDVQFPFAAVILHVNREIIHHGAEVATLRDLYRAQRASP